MIHRKTLLSAAALALAGSTGCMKLDDAEPIQMTTLVEDWRDEIIYQILVDRFANGDGGNDFNVDLTSKAKWHGGDWKGLEDKLDYIQALGVTTLWISPVVQNVDTDAGFDGYHGYWTQDPYAPNPHFGDIPALRSMIASAHARKIKVILDIVTNHMGQVFYYDINMNGQPDDQVSGGGCDKWGNPADSANLYPNYSAGGIQVRCLAGVSCDPASCKPEVNPELCMYFDASSCEVKDGQSGVKHVTEYDPEFNPTGTIQAYTSLGYSGPAPIVFNTDAASNHLAPPGVFGDQSIYNRRGRTINYANGDQLLHGDFPGGLKDVATSRCDVKQGMVDAYARWVEIADFDGFRIDTVKHVEPEFWRYFTQKVRQRLGAQGKKKFLMFGEAFDGDDRLIGSFTKGGDTPELPAAPQDVLGTPNLDAEQKCLSADDKVKITGDMLDSAFYFPQYYSVIADVFRDERRTKGIEELWNQRQQNWGLSAPKDGAGFVPASAPVNFLDNHDVGRFLFYEFFHSDLGKLQKGQINTAQFNDVRKKKLRNAFVFLFTEQGIPCVYYGDEQGFEGGNDPANREDLWDSGYVTTETTGQDGRVYGGYFSWIQKLSKIRTTHKALSRGDLKVAWSTDHTGAEGDAGIFAFERSGGDAGASYALVIVNTNGDHASSPEDGSAKMKLQINSTELVDILGDKPTSYPVAGDGTVSIQVPALGAVVLVPKGQEQGS
jgi:glycosidase